MDVIRVPSSASSFSNYSDAGPSRSQTWKGAGTSHSKPSRHDSQSRRVVSPQVSPRLHSRRAAVEDYYDEAGYAPSNMTHRAATVASSRTASHHRDTRPVTQIPYEYEHESQMHEDLDEEEQEEDEAEDADDRERIYRGVMNSASNTLDSVSEDTVMEDERMAPMHRTSPYRQESRSYMSSPSRSRPNMLPVERSPRQARPPIFDQGYNSPLLSTGTLSPPRRPQGLQREGCFPQKQYKPPVRMENEYRQDYRVKTYYVVPGDRPVVFQDDTGRQIYCVDKLRREQGYRYRGSKECIVKDEAGRPLYRIMIVPDPNALQTIVDEDSTVASSYTGSEASYDSGSRHGTQQVRYRNVLKSQPLSGHSYANQRSTPIMHKARTVPYQTRHTEKTYPRSVMRGSHRPYQPSNLRYHSSETSSDTVEGEEYFDEDGTQVVYA